MTKHLEVLRKLHQEYPEAYLPLFVTKLENSTAIIHPRFRCILWEISVHDAPIRRGYKRLDANCAEDVAWLRSRIRQYVTAKKLGLA